MPVKEKETKIRRGRSSNLIEQRNKMMVALFAFYKTNSNLNYSTIIERLQDVFFISEYTIIDILTDNSQLVKDKMQTLSLTDLEKEYPQLKWKVV